MLLQARRQTELVVPLQAVQVAVLLVVLRAKREVASLVGLQAELEVVLHHVVPAEVVGLQVVLVRPVDDGPLQTHHGTGLTGLGHFVSAVPV